MQTRRSRATRSAGRPRSPKADRAILGAAVRVLRAEGYGRMSVERIAAEAGVGKATIYRRYKDRQELAAAAAVHVAGHRPFDSPDDIDVRTGLAGTIAHVHAAIGAPAVLSMLGSLLAERPHAPAHLQRFWEHVLAPHAAATKSLIEKGKRRGEVKPSTTAEDVSEALLGAVLAREMSGRAITPEWIERVSSLLLDGFASRPRAVMSGKQQPPKNAAKRALHRAR